MVLSVVQFSIKAMQNNYYISVVVPVYNESDAIQEFNKTLLAALEKLDCGKYEVIYCDDGSTDKTLSIINDFVANNNNIKLVKLSRNFGKEKALAAGISFASGDCVLTIDADGQHPISKIPEFIKHWQDGKMVVVGIRDGSSGQSSLGRFSSKMFYKLYNTVSSQKIIPGMTDFCLMDKEVAQQFLNLREPQRLNRVLIDWLGYDRQYVSFTAPSRIGGSSSFNFNQLVSLAAHGLISSSPLPLYFIGFLGLGFAGVSLVAGIIIFIEQFLLGDMLSWDFTGSALLGILLVFLVGILLTAIGLLSAYVSHIHNLAKGRPLFVVDYKHSNGISKNE